MQREIDDLNDRMLNTHTMSEAQIEQNKRRDAEIAKVPSLKESAFFKRNSNFSTDSS